MEKSGITRRDLNKGMVLLSVGSLFGGIGFGALSNHSIPALVSTPQTAVTKLDFKDWVYPGVTGCLVATGKEGQLLARFLTTGSRTERVYKDRDRPLFRGSRLEINCIDVGKDINDRDLVFFVGRRDDPSFWMTRNLVLDCEPPLLLTFMLGRPDTMPHMAPAPNEAMVIVPHHLRIRDLADWISHIFSAIKYPGYIYLDYTDWKGLLPGSRICLETFESPTKRHMGSLARQIGRAKHRLRQYDGFLCLCSWDDPYCSSPDDFSVALDSLITNINEDAFLLATTPRHSHISNAYFRMSMLCGDWKVSMV